MAAEIKNCSILVDDRETSVSPFLARFGAPYTISRITTGDFVIIYSDNNKTQILAVFERKTLEDFAASLKDLRLHTQAANMVEIQKKFPGVQIYYIIEGKAFPKNDETFGRIPYVNISMAISSLEVQFGIQVIQSRDSEHTASKLADKVKMFNKHWLDIAPRYKPIEVALTLPEWPFEVMYTLKAAADANNNNNPEYLANILGDVYKKAAEFTGFPDLLAAIQVGDQPTIEKLNRIAAEWEEITKDIPTTGAMESLTETHTHSAGDMRMQAWLCLPGVSNLTAPTLATKLSLKELVNGQIKKEVIATIKYPSGKNLCKNVAALLEAGPDEKIELKMLKCIVGLGSKADTLMKDRRLKDLLAMTPAQLAAIKVGKNNLGPVKAGEILAVFV